MSDTIWNNNAVQFPRLLAEIMATQDLDMKSLAESMDLSESDVVELFDRVDAAWEAIKREGAEHSLAAGETGTAGVGQLQPRAPRSVALRSDATQAAAIVSMNPALENFTQVMREATQFLNANGIKADLSVAPPEHAMNHLDLIFGFRKLPDSEQERGKVIWNRASEAFARVHRTSPEREEDDLDGHSDDGDGQPAPNR